MLDHLIDLAQIPAGGRVLEIGSGWGCLLKRLREREISVEYRACGPSAQQNEHVKSTIDSSAKIFDCGVENMPLEDGFFDSAFLIASLCHVREKEKQLERIARSLKSGGLLVIEDSFLQSADAADLIQASEGLERFRSELYGWAGLLERNAFTELARSLGLILVTDEDFSKSYTKTVSIWVRALAGIKYEGETESLRRDLISLSRASQLGWKKNASYRVMSFRKS
jgi:cyclopropane-fatty-acyl-phospholipid synthase